MKIPPEVAATLDTDGTPFSHYLDRYILEQRVIEQVLEAVQLSGLRRVIDYGCHLGGWTWALARTSKEVVGIDLNQRYILAGQKIAQANNLTNIEYICASDLSSEPDQSADGIISIGTLPVVQTGDLWHEFFDHAQRILPPGGRILFNTLAPEHLAYHLRHLEPFQYWKKRGPKFVIDRLLGFIRLYLKSMMTTTINHDGRYYVIRPSVVEAFIRQKGFHVVMRHDAIVAHSAIATMPSYPIENLKRPRYLWWVVAKNS